jgi:hypothetical protein
MGASPGQLNTQPFILQLSINELSPNTRKYNCTQKSFVLLPPSQANDRNSRFTSYNYTLYPSWYVECSMLRFLLSRIRPKVLFNNWTSVYDFRGHFQHDLTYNKLGLVLLLICVSNVI